LDEFECRGRKSKGQGQGTNFLTIEMHGNALAANNVMQQQTEPFRRCRGVMGVQRQRGRSVIYVPACVRVMIGKTSLALV